jgi:sugar (pentulose or hexulose) kinase
VRAEDLAASEHILLGSHSLLALKLCGRAVGDRVTASTTGLLLAAGHAYHEEMIEAVLPDVVRLLPPLVSGEKQVGFVGSRAAEMLGLSAAQVPLPVFHGCGDAGATTLGMLGVPGAALAIALSCLIVCVCTHAPSRTPPPPTRPAAQYLKHSSLRMYSCDPNGQVR